MMSHDHFVTFASLFLTWPIYSSLDIGISRYTQTMFIHNFLECKPIKEVSNWCIVCNILAERLIPHIMSNTNEIYREFQSFFFFLHKKCNEFQSFVFWIKNLIVIANVPNMSMAMLYFIHLSQTEMQLKAVDKRSGFWKGVGVDKNGNFAVTGTRIFYFRLFQTQYTSKI